MSNSKLQVEYEFVLISLSLWSNMLAGARFSHDDDRGTREQTETCDAS